MAETGKKVLVVGGGGREHALCWKLVQSAKVSDVFCAPGNGGTAGEAKVKNIDIGVNDFDRLALFCTDREIDLVVVGPDNPLADGIVDFFEGKNIRVFGPRKEEAKLEWSKAHAKQVMQELGIPTAKFAVAGSLPEAEQIVSTNDWARVIKVDGLALGKGVFVCDDLAEALAALRVIYEDQRFGNAATKVVIEERLQGPEISLLTLCDGRSLRPLVPSQDHKRRFADDQGPNTGGMGAYAPVELYDAYEKQIEKMILKPLRDAVAAGTLSYQGVLFIGLLIDKHADGLGTVNVLEFNARFGDPETQTILPLLESDLFDLLWACTDGTLNQLDINWAAKHSCCVVAVARDYPEKSSKGDPITIASVPADTKVFHAGTQLVNGELQTAGGRVLNIVSWMNTMDEAIDQAYKGVAGINFAGMDYRADIARRALSPCP